MGERLKQGVNDLYTWCNQEENKEHAKIILREFGGKDEKGNSISMNNIHLGSSTKVLWKCSKCEYEWYASINHRVRWHRGCHRCAGKVVTNKNSLYTWCINNGDFGQLLIDEWTGLTWDKKKINIRDVGKSSRLSVLWQCKNKSHIFDAKIQDRTYHRNKCPFCLNRRVDTGNSFKTWCNNNGSFGELLKQEWVGIDEDNVITDMSDIVPGKHNKRYLWECKNGHTWYATTRDRIKYKSYCPKCNNRGTSYKEQFIFNALKQIYPQAENRYKAFINIVGKRGIELDIAIDVRMDNLGYSGLAIEYSPTFWHKNKQERDNLKKELCTQNNIRLIQIVDDSYNNMKHVMEEDYICININRSNEFEVLSNVVKYIVTTLHKNPANIDMNRASKDARITMDRLGLEE